MKIAVLSDIHDNIWNLARVMPQAASADLLLFLGDFCAPFTLKQMADGFSGPIHWVPGNNDGDPLLLAGIGAAAGNVSHYNPIGVLDLDGHRIAFTHYPEVAEGLVATGTYRAVFSGHTHVFRQERTGPTLWVNPGEVMGRFGEPSFGFYDTASGDFTRVLLA
ncbi:MAG: metallophosphoesterase family protein [Anaerolineae bacterium]